MVNIIWVERGSQYTRTNATSIYFFTANIFEENYEVH